MILLQDWQLNMGDSPSSHTKGKDISISYRQEGGIGTYRNYTTYTLTN